MTDHIHMANPPKPPRVMQQPKKALLREALSGAADRIEAQATELEALRESRFGAHAVGAAFIAGLVLGVLLSWLWL